MAIAHQIQVNHLIDPIYRVAVLHISIAEHVIFNPQPARMEALKHILLFGAGKSATVLIDYLKKISGEKKWRVTVADADLPSAQLKVGVHDWMEAVDLSVDDEDARNTLVASADVVISLLPPSLHHLVALDCLEYGKHLLTASYVNDEMAGMANAINKKDVLFLCEMGLDPGIDHMSAMQLVHRIKEKGGTIHSFVSHCGGLVAPESDDNPWHYKISWNPRNVVLAGKSGGIFKENGMVKELKYEELFVNCLETVIDGVGTLAYYPNRDSLGYIKTYELTEATTFIRTTLRHPDFCRGWSMVVGLGLTDEKNVHETDSLPVASFLKLHFSKKNLRTELDDPLLAEQFSALGLADQTLINKGPLPSADILQFIIEKKWALQPGDKDMVVMQHEIGYELDGKHFTVKSSLVVKGEDEVHTAMAKTVGLPLGIAATLLLEGKISERGLHIPTVAGIYEPVLAGLTEYGIVFNETHV
jgi:saccharopine dehydrogenase (NADP+, L-glutamate forming)